MLSVPSTRQAPAGWEHVSIFTATVRLDSGLTSPQENEAEREDGRSVFQARCEADCSDDSCVFVLVGGAAMKGTWNKAIPRWLLPSFDLVS